MDDILPRDSLKQRVSLGGCVYLMLDEIEKRLNFVGVEPMLLGACLIY